MTRYAPLWQQAGNYTAQVDRQLMAALWPVGGADGAAPFATANTMLMNYPAGLCAVPLSGNNGVALCRWDAAEQVTIGAAPGAGTTRIDLVVCQVRDNALDAGANNDFWFVVVPGVPAASPVAPATPANAYVMTTVTVPASVANLNTATITDRRSPLSAAVPHSGGAVNAGATLSWVQGGWGNWPPGPGLTVPFTKFRDATALHIHCASSFYVGPTTSNRALLNPASTAALTRLAGIQVNTSSGTTAVHLCGREIHRSCGWPPVCGAS